MMRIFSGIQPTGNLHLGNYLGAIRNWVALQDQAECLYCIVDLHAITLWQEPDALRSGIREMAAALIACGIDPKRSILFNQSMVREHAELAWVLYCVARVGWVNRMTQFKDKAGKDKEGASVGLYTYPVLQAADIIVYGATHVPVGEDQRQHLELARDIAIKFNNDYKTELLVPPETIVPKLSARVMSLRDGSVKMSKSDASDMSRINLTDDADTIRNKIKRAKTDPEPLPDNEAELATRPEAANLVGIYATLSGESVDEVLQRYAGKGFGVFKPDLGELLVTSLSPISERFRALKDDHASIDAILRDGAERATAIAAPLLRQVYDTVGFLQLG